VQTKKITFLINSLSSGGAEKVLATIANSLVKDYDVEIIFLEKNEFYKLDNRVKKTYLSDFNGNESVIKKLFYLPILAWKLKKYIQKNNIKLIQSHVYRANYVNVLAKILGAKHKTQIVNHGRVSRYKEQGLFGKVNLFLVKHFYFRADLIILISLRMQEDMQKLFHFTNKQIVINNPHDIEKIEKLSSDKVDDFNFDKDKKYLISIGRLIPLKRNSDLLRALSKLDKSVEAIFLGDGREKESLKNLAKELGVEQRVHFLGQVDNPYKYLKNSDIFVSCSESEGFPNVLVESMICEIPVISSDCVSGPREILAPEENNQYGFLFDVGDINQMVNDIRLLLVNKSLQKELIKKAKKRAYDFSLDKILNKYKKVLEID